MRLALKDLAEKFGHITKPSVDGVAYRWKHACADQMHGWTAYEYSNNTKIKISEQEYLKALEAAAIGQTYSPAVFKRK
jgi:hypothetical protein